jgi:hypothetical protein
MRDLLADLNHDIADEEHAYPAREVMEAAGLLTQYDRSVRGGKGSSIGPARRK